MTQVKATDSVIEVDFKSLNDKKVAILDDSKLSSHNLTIKLQFVGERPIVFKNSDRGAFLEAARENQFLAVIIGSLSSSTVEEELKFLHENQLNLPVIIASDQFESDSVDETLMETLVAIHERPVHYEKLVEGLDKAREMIGIDANPFESVVISESGAPLFRGLVGNSKTIQKLRKVLEQLTGKTTSVLITGESGTGKEIVARNLHYGSGRGNKPFVIVDCAALTKEEFSKALFGREAGSGEARHQGLIESANEGSIFLDKIDELPVDAQAKLMHFIETKKINDLDAEDEIEVDVRVISSTTQNLEQCVKENKFRLDLFYAINVFPIQMPTLLERAEDIPDLVNELIARVKNYSGSGIRFNSAAMLSLQRYPWPGNVRELANLVERLSIINENEVVGVNDLPSEYRISEDEDYLHSLEEEGEVVLSETEVSGSAGADKTVNAEMENNNAKSQDIKNSNLEAPQHPAETLTEDSLSHYLENFSRHLMAVALDDCAQIASLAAERLNMSLEDFESQRQALNV